MMGTDSGGPDEWPQHPVTINAFEMTATEITFSQYIVCVDEGICTEPDPWPEPNCHWGMNGVDDYPVDCVDWFQSIQFCSWVGGRLPTEAEWEYAARNAGMVIDYPWGLDLPTECVHANYNRCAPVVSQACSYPQGNTGYGLCDLAGNLAEWTQDCLQGNYIGAPTDGSAWEECVDENHARVVRGGSWVSGASDIRTYSRGYNWPFSRNGYTGIRCVKDSIP